MLDKGSDSEYKNTTEQFIIIIDSKNDKLRVFLRSGYVFCIRYSHFNHVGLGRNGSKTFNLSITRTKIVNNSSVGKKNT